MEKRLCTNLCPDCAQISPYRHQTGTGFLSGVGDNIGWHNNSAWTPFLKACANTESQFRSLKFITYVSVDVIKMTGE
jgi:hypothetical protein